MTAIVNTMIGKKLLQVLVLLPILSACAAAPIPAGSPDSGSLQVIPSTTPLPAIINTTEPAAVSPGVTPAPTSTPTDTAEPLAGGAFSLPTETPYPVNGTFVIGQSWEGRPIEVVQFGSGDHAVVLIGGIHGGYEINTVELSNLLIGHFQQRPDDVLPNIRLMIIPNANPDGVVRGTGIEARFNARGVDLNRNWGCEWEATAVVQDLEVNPGSRIFSEPETQVLRQFFLSMMPDVVLFYHSAAGGVFLGECMEAPAPRWLGDLLEESTGYPHYESFDYYHVTGDASNWLVEQGIPAAVIELYSRDLPEFEANLRGVLAIQCHYVQLDLDEGRFIEGQAAAYERLCGPFGADS